jgi:hypothetical protein
MSGATEHILGNVSFGPAPTLWEEQPTLRELYDQACAGLVRAECEIEELRAEVAMLRAQADILQSNVEKARKRAGVLYKCWIKAESERDEACRESCRDKASADGGWANI